MQYENLINKLIDLGIEEDINTGDITTESIIPESMNAVATMTAKQDGVISGLEIVKLVYERFQKDTVFTPYFKNGDSVKKGDVILKVEATYPTLLRGERLSLNIFQRMCGIATETAKYVKELVGTSTELLDTRKTAPGLRVLDKMAVKDGGGTNHRMGLYDMAMIKDNHIKMAGGITKAVEQVRANIPADVKIEVEATNLAEVQEAVAAGADIIMFDNMTNEAMTEAAAYIKSTGKPIKTEASGNMSIPRLKEVAATGVDYISVGALTHTVKAMDISMNIQVE
ncbi:MAG: carboxylating nicotinate-nucleotide diphosphorylase [Alistipes sp.]|nr:carboxylating nicotinate-nucleotide diphosphorylase [Alistipes sp.]MBQ8779741.1 carboxylating nicotinate-nucleotide diphosphorylase [Alistipes sp.]MBR2170618.1 carboxylating nicotinate-nucleotide diphosphorylase [Alistipes sp.]MBR2332396.1 carboxylating nicotinate-nucleotide diphosphorylase [Alistipes sp.]MBR2398931.1 carboxylating nicotinate-nucleotide diphosphorylase [Alistipes sp.]